MKKQDSRKLSVKEEIILTVHTRSKKGVNILKIIYDQIGKFILSTFEKRKEITFQELTDLAMQEITNSFDGKVVGIW